MKFREKCSFLFRLIDFPNDKEYYTNSHQIVSMSKDRSPFIRSLVAKLLIEFNDAISMEMLMSLSFDKDNLVRAEAAQSMQSFSHIAVLDRLRNIAESDKFYIARAYALHSMSIIGKDTKPYEAFSFVENRLGKERYVFNKIAEILFFHFFQILLHHILF